MTLKKKVLLSSIRVNHRVATSVTVSQNVAFRNTSLKCYSVNTANYFIAKVIASCCCFAHYKLVSATGVFKMYCFMQNF